MGHQAVKSHSKGAHRIAHVAKLEKSVKNSSLLTDFMPMKPSTSYTTCGDGDVLAKLPGPTPTPSTFRLKEDTLDAEIMWTLFNTEHHISYSTQDSVKGVFQFMFKDSSVAKEFSCGATKSSYVSNFGIAPYFRKLLKSKANEEYVLLFDESLNKTTKTKQLDLLVRFWDKDKDCVVTRFLDSQYMGHARADDLMEHVAKSLADLAPSKLVQVSPFTLARLFVEILHVIEIIIPYFTSVNRSAFVSSDYDYGSSYNL
jgi:hypothetical protein